MRRDLARDYKSELDKLRKAFKKLRQSSIYAQARPIGIDSNKSQQVIKNAMDQEPDLRGGIYWSSAAEQELEETTILHLGFMPRSAETREEMMAAALKIAKDANQALIEAGLVTIWNGCVCNTIGVVLLDRDLIQDGLDPEDLASAKKPCRCEEIWQMQFQDFAERKLGNLKGQDSQNSWENDEI